MRTYRFRVDGHEYIIEAVTFTAARAELRRRLETT
jgi:hypothetical protein